MPCYLIRVGLLSLLFAPLFARAADVDSDIFAFNGFGTLGAVHSSTRLADFTNGNYQPNGAGHTHEWSLDVDSRLGGQLTANFSPQLSAVLQVVVEQQSDNTYTPQVEWANIRYAITPGLSVRAGRVELPSYLTSDSVKAGYTYPLARPPIELYRLLPITNSDGIDSTYRFHFLDMTNSVTAIFGTNKITNTRGQQIDSTNIRGIFDKLEDGPLTLHAAYQIRDASTLTPPRTRFASIGADYEPGTWFLMTEWGTARLNYKPYKEEILKSWFASCGFRLGAFTPYVSWSNLRSSEIVPPQAEKNTALGVRWDFATNIDLKLQAERIKLDPGSVGFMRNVQPGFQPGSSVDVVTVLFDFIF